MSEFKQYRRKQVAELAEWTPDFVMVNISISEEDKKSWQPEGRRYDCP